MYIVQQEREAMIKEARDIKVKMISDAKEEAKTTADAIISQAQEAIEKISMEISGADASEIVKYALRFLAKGSN